MTSAQRKALRNAAARPRGNICPTADVHAGASQRLCDALVRQGYAYMDGPSPRITDAGRAAILNSEVRNG